MLARMISLQHPRDSIRADSQPAAAPRACLAPLYPQVLQARCAAGACAGGRAGL